MDKKDVQACFKAGIFLECVATNSDSTTMWNFVTFVNASINLNLLCFNSSRSLLYPSLKTKISKFKKKKILASFRSTRYLHERLIW